MFRKKIFRKKVLRAKIIVLEYCDSFDIIASAVKICGWK